MKLLLLFALLLNCQSIGSHNYNDTTLGKNSTSSTTFPIPTPTTSARRTSSTVTASTTSSFPTTFSEQGANGKETRESAVPVVKPYLLPLLSAMAGAPFAQVQNDGITSSSGGGTSSFWTATNKTAGATSFPFIQTKSRVVDTKYGKIQGIAITLFPSPPGASGHYSSSRNNPLKNKHVEVFFNIPYASPPVRGYRFFPTQTPSPWEGIRSGVKPGFVCPQMMPDIRNETAALKDMPRGYLEYLRRVEPFLRNQSEDCLYLNVFSPYGAEVKLKPVVVFIHGGRFAWGSGNLSDGTVLAAYADVVFVAINYRLGVLGFLNANPSPTSKPRVANYGLMDQIAALQWIKENIMFFGGDPDNITLMGYEAGAACIHFLMSSPAVTPGLFHRSVLIAGSSRAPWALVQDPSAVATALAEALNCSLTGLSNNNTMSAAGGSGINNSNNNNNNNGSSFAGHGKSSNSFSGPSSSSSSSSSSSADPIIDCLKNKHFSYFSKLAPPKFSVDFGPSVDGVVIKPNFAKSYGGEYGGNMGKRDITKKYDLLFGLSSVEKMTAFSEDDLAMGFEAQRRDAILRTLIRNSYRFHLNEIFATITNEYIDWERSNQHPITTRDLTLNAVTDCLSLAPVIAAAESNQVTSKTFFYVFDHATKDGLYNYQRSGAAGGEELNYMLGYPLVDQIVGQVLPVVPSPIPSNYTKSEMALSELVLTFLSNFVHSGDPNEPMKREGVWPVSKEGVRSRNTVWEPYDRLHQKYLEISANKIKSRSHYRAHQMAIWLRLVPELQRSGAHYASNVHSRMIGGNDPSLYIGSLRLPHEEEVMANPQYIDLGYGPVDESMYNGLPPSPPTTCLSPLSSSSSATSGGNATAYLGTGNETLSELSAYSPYSTILSATIAVGCSLLIVNVFIFAMVYYQRDKKRAKVQRQAKDKADEGDAAAQGRNEIGVGGGNSMGEVPELVKSNTATAGQTTIQMSSTGTETTQGQVHAAFGHHGGIMLSPHQIQSYHQSMMQHHNSGLTTLPRSNGGLAMVGTLPKPPPPPRSVSNFSTLPHRVSAGSNVGRVQQASQQQQQLQSRMTMTNSTYSAFDDLKV